MKSKTSFFNSHIYFSDIRRYYPLWLLYTILMGIVMLPMTLLRNVPYDVVAGLQIMGLVNGIYASLCAITLFGDLFDSRRCNALHALPLTRDCWFVSHLAAGLTFGTVPYIVVCGIKMLANPWAAPGLALFCIGAAAQFVVFFGVALFCVMLAGNQTGGVLLTGFVNLLSMQVFCFVSLIYVPLLKTVELTTNPFLLYSPLTALMSGEYYDYTIKGVTFSIGWRCLCIYFGVSVVLMAVAWLLYRKRDLECAGDFLAFRPVGPVLTVLVSLCSGSLLYGFFELFGSVSYVNMVLGVAIAFFVCQMLIRKSVKVFGLKELGYFAGVLAAIVLSMVITWFDPMGIAAYVPDANDVDSAWFAFSFSYKDLVGDDELNRAVIEIQKAAMQEKEPEDSDDYYSLRITYKMKDGREVCRNYLIISGSEADQKIRSLSSSRLVVFGKRDYESLLADDDYSCYVNDVFVEKDVARELIDAICKDCDDGHFEQVNSSHTWDGNSIYIEFRATWREQVTFEMRVSDLADNTLKVMYKYNLFWE